MAKRVNQGAWRDGEGMSNVEHLLRWGKVHRVEVKSKDLTSKQILAVACETCGAAAGEVCQLDTGDPRSEPHRVRKLSAAEKAGKTGRAQRAIRG